MVVTVDLTIFAHPKEEIEDTLISASRRLTDSKDSIKGDFPERDNERVILQLWMPDKAHSCILHE